MSASQSSNWRVAYTSLAIKLGETITSALYWTPSLRILEANVCRSYYRIHDPSVIDANDNVLESLCKVADIQSEVSHISGTSNVISLIPWILAALPYLTSRRDGNKRNQLLFNEVGSFITLLQYVFVLYFYNVFDPRWIWINGIFSFIGGGDLVLFGLLQALTAESIEQSKLSGFYMYASAIALITSVVFKSVGLYLMKSSPWIPIWPAFIAKLICFPIILIFLQDLPSKVDAEVESDKTNDIRLLAAGETADDDDNDVPNEILSELPPLKKQRKSSLFPNSSTWAMLLEQRDILVQNFVPLSILTLHELGNSFKATQEFWLSKRYGWTIRETGWVLLGISLFTAGMVAALPRLSKRLYKVKDTSDSQRRDLSLARGSLLFYILGTTLIGFSWYPISGVTSLALIACGFAFRDAYMGYLTAHMQREEISRIYVAIEMVSLIGFCVGSWVVADLYALTLKLGDTWATSLPAWVCVVPFVVAWYYVR